MISEIVARARSFTQAFCRRRRAASGQHL